MPVIAGKIKAKTDWKLFPSVRLGMNKRDLSILWPEVALEGLKAQTSVRSSMFEGLDESPQEGRHTMGCLNHMQPIEIQMVRS